MSTYNKITLSELSDKLYKLLDNEHSYSKKKIYFAGPWFTDKAKVVMNYCIALVDKLGCANNYDIYFPMQHTDNDSPSNTFDDNISQINKADIVVALIQEKDTGTAFEIGYAASKGKYIVLLGYDESCFKNGTNIMLAFAANKCITLDKLSKFLRNDLNGDKDCVMIEDNWEGKQ